MGEIFDAMVCIKMETIEKINFVDMQKSAFINSNNKSNNYLINDEKSTQIHVINK